MRFDGNLLDCAVKFYLGRHVLVAEPAEMAGPGRVSICLEYAKGAWVIWGNVAPMAPFYLNPDGSWRYKSGGAWASKDEALAAFERSDGRIV